MSVAPTYRVDFDTWAALARGQIDQPTSVRETTTTTGTGPLTLAGAMSGYQTAASVYDVGEVFLGGVTDGVDWEYGYFTLSAGSVVARSLIQASTNDNAPVNWGIGSRIFVANVPDVRTELLWLLWTYTNPLLVPRGGTGLQSGTSGGILGFTGATTLASSVALTANALVLGAGAGATPIPLTSLGTTTTVLHGNIAGAPTFGPVSLTADVSGILPLANGGSNAALAASLGAVPYSTASALALLPGNTTTTRKFLRQTGDGIISAAPAWDSVVAADVPGSALTRTNDTNVTLTLGGSPATALLNAASLTVGWTGTLAPARGGLGAANTATSGTFPRGDGANFVTSTLTLPNTLTANQVLYGTGTNAVGASANMAFDGSTLTLGGTGTAYNILVAPSAGDAKIGISRSTNAQQAYIGLTPAGANTSSNVAWSFGMLGGSNSFNLQAWNGSVTTPYWTVTNAGLTGLGASVTPTAILHLKAGTTAANSAPLKFTSGSLLTTPEALAVEALTDKLYATITTGAARKEIALNDSALTSGSLIEATTNGRIQNATTTGSGSAVRASSPTLVTPVLGDAAATTLTLGTTSATAGTLRLPNAAWIAARSVSNTADVNLVRLNVSNLVEFGANSANTLGMFAATSSATLASVISDETGSGSLVFATSPTLIAPILGAATATSVNKVAITAPATSATLTIADGKTATISNTLTLTGTDGSSLNVGGGGSLGSAAFTAATAYAPAAGSASVTTLGTVTTGTWNATAVGPQYGGTGQDWSASSGMPLLTSGVASLLSSTGSGNVVRATSPALVTPSIGAATGTSVVLTGSVTSNALTSGRVPIIGASGIIQDDATLLFGSSTLTVPALKSTGAVLQTGTVSARFENSAATRPAGATGIGAEIFIAGGAASLQSFDPAGAGSFAPLTLRGSVIRMSPSATLEAAVGPTGSTFLHDITVGDNAGVTVAVNLNAASATAAAFMRFQSGGSNRWGIGRGPADLSDNFQIYNYGAAAADFAINYTTRAVTIAGKLTVGTAQTYAASNVTTDRTYDADVTTLAELADIVGTLIADLRAIGLVN